MGSHVSSQYEKNGVMVFMKKFQLKKMMFRWWPSIDVKWWMLVNHVSQLLSILTVNTSGCPYTFLKCELKDTQKQFTENLWTWKDKFMYLPKKFVFQLITVWSSLKTTLDFNTYQGFLFLFFTQLFLVISMNLFMK